MAKRRMAGEKVAEAMSQADRNRAARERRANDPEQLAALMGKVDRDKYDFEGYDDKQIAMAFQGDSFADEDYARLTGKSMGGGDSKPDPTPDEGAVTTPTAPGSITVDNSTQGPGAGIADLIDVIKALPSRQMRAPRLLAVALSISARFRTLTATMVTTKTPLAITSRVTEG